MTTNLSLFFSVPFFGLSTLLMFSSCHTFPLPHTITIHNLTSHPWLHLANPSPHLCASPDNVNCALRPTGTSACDPQGTVTIVGNTISHHPPLELVIECMESDIVHALMMTTAGGYTLNCPTSLTVITPGAWCAQSMGHILPLHLQPSCAPTSAHTMTSCTCRTTCSNAVPSKMLIGCSAMWRQTTRTCNWTMPASRKRMTNWRLVLHPWAPYSFNPLWLMLPCGHHLLSGRGHRSKNTHSANQWATCPQLITMMLRENHPLMRTHASQHPGWHCTS